MALTPVRSFPYCGPDDAPDVSYWQQQLAEKSAAEVQALADALAAQRPFGHAGITNGFSAPGAGGRAPFDAAQVLRGGMAFDNTNDALTVPKAGLYRINLQSYASGAGWGTQSSVIYVKPASLAADYQPGINTRYYREGSNGPPDTCYHATGTVQLAAGDKVYLVQWFTGQTNTWGTNGYNGTYLEVEFSQP